MRQFNTYGRFQHPAGYTAAIIMTRGIFVLLPLAASLMAQPSPLAAASLDRIKVVLVGDSTVSIEGGWGPGFCAHLIAAAECLDVAVNGRSTKSFIDEGLWAKALEARGQFYFIQFGHNDQKDQVSLHTDPATTFKANLHRYVRDVRELGGTAILVTSLTRRNYRDGKLIVDPLREYAAATREVAAEDNETSFAVATTGCARSAEDSSVALQTSACSCNSSHAV